MSEAQKPQPLVETRVGSGPAWEDCESRGGTHMSLPESDACIWCGAKKPESRKDAKP